MHIKSDFSIDFSSTGSGPRSLFLEYIWGRERFIICSAHIRQRSRKWFVNLSQHISLLKALTF